MNIIFAGDTHGPLDHLKLVSSGSIVVHLGDLAPLASSLEDELPPGLHDRFYWIPGNHEFDSAEHFDKAYTRFGQSCCLHLNIAEIAGIRIAGLGGIFSEKTWWPKASLVPGKISRESRLRSTGRQDRFRGGLGLKQRKYIFLDDFEALAAHQADVLVAHEAPTSHPYGFYAINQLARELGVHTVVHGHHHVDYSGQIECGIRVIGVGLRGLTSLDGEVIKPGETTVRRRA